MSSLSDVAKLASVATSTVSRALSGRPNVSEETLKRVKQAAVQVGYRHRPAGRPRKARAKSHIGVLYAASMLVSGELVAFCRDWIDGIRQGVLASESYMEVLAGHKDFSQDAMYHRVMEKQDIHGFILLGTSHHDPYLKDIIARKVPCVAIGNRAQRGEFSSVYADIYGGARTAVEHLIASGHRRIAILGLPVTDNWASKERHDGVIDALQAHSLKPALDHQGRGSFEDTSAYDAGCDRILASGATGVICGDYLAIRYIEAFARRGISVPGDISFIGFDNTGLVAQTGHELTTFDYDKNRMGNIAASMLMKLIHGKNKFHHLEACVPTWLVERQTTGAPADQDTTRA